MFLCPCHPLNLLTPFSFIIKFVEVSTFMSLLSTSEGCRSLLSAFSVHWAADRFFFSSKTHHCLTIGEKKRKFRKLVCGFLQFVPHTNAHQQYSSKELAHSYECVFKLKVYSAFLVWCCAEIMGGKYFYQATESTLMPGKAVATSCHLCKAVKEERSHSSHCVQAELWVTPQSWTLGWH